MKYFKKLVAEKIYLSPINEDDYLQYTQWINDTSIGINFGQASRVTSIEREKEFLAGMTKSGINLAIVKLENDELLGNCSLMHIHQINRTAELGIFIGAAGNRNRGYGTEAAKLMVEYGVRILNLQNIMLRVFEYNTNAIKAYQKAGFKQFGRRTGSCYLDGKYYDEIYMEIRADNVESVFLKDILP